MEGKSTSALAASTDAGIEGPRSRPSLCEEGKEGGREGGRERGGEGRGEGR
jgi:hypothetical protein